MRRFGLSLICLFGLLTATEGRETIRLANYPSLSPDGKMLAFEWGGDIWTVPVTGGVAQPLTRHPARDSEPKFSPDGKTIAFISDRDGSNQIYTIPVEGGTPKQITFHTAGYTLYEWLADSSGFLTGTNRDYGWGRNNNHRLHIVKLPKEGQTRLADQLLFDDYAQSGTFSPDGARVLFTREGAEWWRKGYKGSMAGQIWQYDLKNQSFSRPIAMTQADDLRWPLWVKNGIVYVNGAKGVFNLMYQPEKGTPVALTNYTDDSVVFPAVSRDGSTLVFRKLFDLYRMKPAPGSQPEKIEIFRDDDRPVERIERRTLTTATAVAFTHDGLELAFIAGGDLWVMDTELREPKRVTATPYDESSPIFAPDGKSILFVAERAGKCDIFRAKRKDEKRPWFLNNNFVVEPVTNDGEYKTGLSFSPEGSKLAYIKGRGNLIVADADGKNPKEVIQSWNAPSYDWSPDAKWIVYAIYDNDFNRDIWIKPIDGSKPPVNISRHPYNDDDPVWSPDGRVIAYIGARDEKTRTDIHFVYLRAEDAERGTRDRTVEKAIEKYNKGKLTPTTPKKGEIFDDFGDQEVGPKPREVNTKTGEKDPPAKKSPPEVGIDWQGIKERTRRVSIPNSNESNLLFSPDSKRLAFTATIDGTTGTYTIELPENLKPTLLSSQTGTQARWLKNNSIVWLSGGRPGSISGNPALPTAGGGSLTAPRPTVPPTGNRPTPTPVTGGGYTFTAYQDIDLALRNQAAFDTAWRIMRDNWYDSRLGNKDWNAIFKKYHDTAETLDSQGLTTVIQLMLGELNGSHLGFFYGISSLAQRRPAGSPDEPTDGRNWRPVTAHLGVRFDDFYNGPGWKIRHVLPTGPADQKKSKLFKGDIILEVDDKPVTVGIDPSLLLNGPPNRDVTLKVKGTDGKERSVILRPITFTAARQLLYKGWINDNRAMVEKLSKGTLGYLHISAMDQTSFKKFEEDLYEAGAGKEGLVIDVRENGGGSTADLLLTALTQPRHAITVPRDGGQGYPQDRTVFATWHKPIIVLCNQNSFSNAEIFSHAIKNLGRGKLVGVPTAGGVISTGATTVMDVGLLRLPFRGWYDIKSGQDMELNGATPDVIIWNEPGDLAKGKDRQLEKAVGLLLTDVENEKAKPKLTPKYATERK